MTTLKIGIASYEEMKARTMAVARRERRICFRRAEGLVHFDRVLRQGTVGRQPRAAARHRGEGARLARRAGAHHRQGQVKPVAHAANNGRLWPGPPRTRRARPHHAEGNARPGGAGPADHAVAQGKLNHDRSGGAGQTAAHQGWRVARYASRRGLDRLSPAR